MHSECSKVSYYQPKSVCVWGGGGGGGNSPQKPKKCKKWRLYAFYSKYYIPDTKIYSVMMSIQIHARGCRIFFIETVQYGAF